MILTCIEAKKYLRLEEDYTEEDTDIEALIIASEGYLKNAGCILNPNDELAKLAVKMLVVNWYENRELIVDSNNTKLPFGLQSLISQLKYCYNTNGGTA